MTSSHLDAPSCFARSPRASQMKFFQWVAVASYVDAAILRRSLLVALVVGPTLLWVNQGPLFMFSQAIDCYKVALTFSVPFVVSLVSGTAARIEASIGKR